MTHIITALVLLGVIAGTTPKMPAPEMRDLGPLPLKAPRKGVLKLPYFVDPDHTV